MPDGLRRARRLTQLLVFAVLWGLITHGTYAGSGDEPHYLAVAHSLAFDQDLDVSNNYGPREPFIAGGALEPGLHARPGVDGRLRPVHDVGLPALFVPYVLFARPLAGAIAARAPASLMRRARLTPTVLYRHLLSFGMMLLAAVLAGLLFDAFLRSGNPRRAAGWTLLVMLSPPTLAYSVLFFTELVTALVALLLVVRLARAQERRAAEWFALGALTGFLLLVHVRNVGLVLALGAAGVASAWRSGARSAALPWYAAGAAIPVAARTALNQMMWGALVTGPHASPGPWPGWEAAIAGIARRAAGLLADQEYGLLIYAPVFVLAPFGWRALRRQDPRLAWLAAATIAGYLVPVLLPGVNRHGWTGGWSPAGRWLMPIVPLLAVFASSGARAVPRPAAAAIVILQLVLSAAFWNAPKLLWNDGDGRAAFCRALPEGACGYLPSLVEPSDRVAAGLWVPHFFPFSDRFVDWPGFSPRNKRRPAAVE